MIISGYTKLFIKKYLKYLISLLILAFIVFKYDWTDVFNGLLKLPTYVIFILILIVCAQLFINALIKSTMLRLFNFHLPVSHIFKRMFIGTYYGVIMPQTIGGDYYYVYYFGKKFNDYTKIFSGIFLIRIVGFVVFTLLALVTFSLISRSFFNNWEIKSINLNNLIFIATGILILVLCFLYFFRKFFKKAFLQFRDKFSSIQKDILNNYPMVILIFLLSICFYVVSIGARVSLGRIIGIELPVKEMMLVIMIVNFLILLPISIGGIGVREGGYIALMGIMGINSTQALSLSILDFSIYLIAVLAGGIFSISSKDDIKIEEGKI